jgi:hypothetical protein
MYALMKKLRIEADKLNLEQEDAPREYEKMKAVFETLVC